MQVGIGGAKLRALYDTGACRTFISSVRIQMATMCEVEIHLYSRKMKSSSGTLSEITGLVDLAFEIGGIRKEVTICISPSLDGDCYLGADWIRQFGATLNPINNLLHLQDSAEPVQAELAVNGLKLAAVGLADVDDSERARIDALSDNLFPKDVLLVK